MKKHTYQLITLILSYVVLSTTLFAVTPLGSASEITSTNISSEAFAANFNTESTEVSEKTYPLNPNGLVSVSNLNGSIKVTGWDRPEVKLITKKSARTPEALEGVKVLVESNGAKFRVKVRYEFDGRTRKWNQSGGASVSFDLMVPKTAIVDRLESTNGSVRVNGTRKLTVVSAVNGSIKAMNLSGQVALESVNGSVSATMDGGDEIRQIRLGSVNGSASVYLPSSIDAIVKAETINGSIRNDFGIPVKKGKYVGSDMYAKIGAGESKVLLTSVNGSINMRRLDDNGKIGAITNLVTERNFKASGSRLVREVNRDIENTRKKQGELIARLVEKVAVAAPDVDVNTPEGIAKQLEIATELAGQNIEIAETEIAEGIKALNRTAGRQREAEFSVETQEFDVPQNPKVNIDAKGVDVDVKVWDEARVVYRLSRIVNGGVQPVKYVNNEQTDSGVNIEVKAVPVFGSRTFEGVTPGGVGAKKVAADRLNRAVNQSRRSSRRT